MGYYLAIKMSIDTATTWMKLKNIMLRSSHHGSVANESTRNHEVVGLIPGLTQWVKDPSVAVSFGVGRTRGSDPLLLWL